MGDEELESLLEEIRADLKRWRSESGGVFYSSRSTLAKGDFYLMGLNPGGDPEKNKTSIDEDLGQWKVQKAFWSAYLDEDWINDDADEKYNGKKPHQARVSYFCEKRLGVKVRDVFSANALFVRTRNEKNRRKN